MRILYFLLAMMFLILVLTHSTVSATQVHYEDFNGSLGSATGYTGIDNQPSVGGYAGIGTGSNTFGGNFAHSYGSGNPAPAIELTLSGLAPHTSIDVNFLLAVIDSWDGSSGSLYSPDAFNVSVDGTLIFKQTFDNIYYWDQGYNSPTGVLLTWADTNIRFSGTRWSYEDSAYDMGLDPVFDGIVHSATTLKIEWWATGGGPLGFEGNINESWALDNVEVILNGTSDQNPIPEPATIALLGIGLVGLAGGVVRRRLKK